MSLCGILWVHYRKVNWKSNNQIEYCWGMNTTNPSHISAEEALRRIQEIQRIYHEFEDTIDRMRTEQKSLMQQAIQKKEQADIDTIRRQIEQLN